jgi:hypothetical protein
VTVAWCEYCSVSCAQVIEQLIGQQLTVVRAGTNALTGALLVQVSFDPSLVNTRAAKRTWYVGGQYFDPVPHWRRTVRRAWTPMTLR